MNTRTKRILALAAGLALAVGVQAQTRSITNQLVVHLSFDNTLNDDSGRGNNAGYVNSNGLSIFPAGPTYVSGKLGQGFQFNTYPDGSLIEYATLGYPDDLKFGTATDFSISFWFNALTNHIVGGGDPAIMANRDWNSSSSRGWGVFLQGGNSTVRVHYTVTEPSVSKFSVRPNTPSSENLYDGAWHHIVVTCQRGGNMNIYVDGAKENSPTAYPASTATFDTDSIIVGANAVPETINIGQDGTGSYTQGPGNNPPPQAGTAGVTNAVVDDVGIWRRVLTDTEVINIYNFAQLGTNLFNVPDVHTPIVTSFAPINGAVGVLPNIPTTAVIQDGDTQLDSSSVKLFVDGVQVIPTITKVVATNTISYTSPFLFAPLSVHTNKLVFADNGTPLPSHFTNINVYTIAAWSNLNLGTPIYVENFDELATPTNGPASYPTGWTAQNCTTPAQNSGTYSLLDATSDAYLDWQIVPIGVISAYFNYDGRILNVNGAIVANGAVVPVLGSNNIAFAASDQRSGSQVDYLFTTDYDLTGKTNVWVAFNSMFSQEHYELGALEYSIDQGTTWLPIVYMLDNQPGTVIYTNSVIDSYTTLTTNNLKIPFGTCGGNFYGNFIGADPSLYGSLGPYFSIRQPGDHVTWHRIEQYRIAQADGQSKVRFRFAFVGANFWDWGFDNFGLYTMAPAEAPQITSTSQSGNQITLQWNGTAANAASGLQKTSSLSPSAWANIPGTIGQSSFTDSTTGTAAYYRVVRY